jgi:ribonucleoside-diphosphate reductase alpha chain
MSESELDELVEVSPWHLSQAEEIDYLEKIQMQGKIQKWIDHSISVTHNLPKDITIEEVNDIYFKAWKAGCKGVTIYREGSRSGVLITKNEEKEDEFKETIAPKRPKELKADYYFGKANGKEFAVIVGIYKDTNKPYELFAFENPEHKKNTSGKLIKVRKGQYKFVNDHFEIENVELATDNIEARGLTLMVSMLLRHGAPIRHINNVIRKIDENIVSFSSVIRRTLSRYDKPDEDGEKCPECGGKIIMQDGCKKCGNCGWSKCG